MRLEEVELAAIGAASTPYKKQSGVPIQPNMGKREFAEIHIEPEYREGLNDLDGFERIWIISYLHRSNGVKMKVVPYRDTVERGLFSTRAPCRPNRIGLSLVTVKSIDVKKGIIKVHGIDLMHGTPILDIKPYFPGFECYPNSRAGWLDKSDDVQIADDRFNDNGNGN